LLERARKHVRRGDEECVEPFRPTKSTVDNVMNAMKAETYTKVTAPAWLIDNPDLPDPLDVVAARNCLLRLRADGQPSIIDRPTPIFFSPNALDYDYDPHALSPRTWLRFLDTIFPDDAQSIELLQEF